MGYCCYVHLEFWLICFFILFAQLVAKGKWTKLGIALCGSISMLFTSLIYTRYHDPFTIGAGGFGIIALALIFATLRHARLPYFKVIFLGVVVLVLGNNFIYFSSIGLIALPLLQKISFAYFLIWIGYLNVVMVRGRVGQ